MLILIIVVFIIILFVKVMRSDKSHLKNNKKIDIYNFETNERIDIL